MAKPIVQSALAYVRTSTSEQLNHTGPDRQLENIQACAKAKNLKIVDVFTDDISGTIPCFERPQFQALLSALLKNGIQYVVVESLGRLARDISVQNTILAYLASHGYNLIASDTGLNVTEAITKDPMYKAMVNMMGVFWQLERDMIVSRLQAGRKLSGRRGGRPTFYSIKLRQQIRDLYASGKSYNKIAALLNEQGVTTSKGTEWSPQLVRQVAIKGGK
jgi:DNA invertase Pin-like site-specific DNA recombinase